MLLGEPKNFDSLPEGVESGLNGVITAQYTASEIAAVIASVRGGLTIAFLSRAAFLLPRKPVLFAQSLQGYSAGPFIPAPFPLPGMNRVLNPLACTRAGGFSIAYHPTAGAVSAYAARVLKRRA